MKRGYLFVTGLITAIATFIILNVTLANTRWAHNRYGYYRHHYCNDERYYRDHEREQHAPLQDSTTRY